MNRFLRARRILASLRPEPPAEPLDPCGAPPLEAARRSALATLIATMSRHLR